MRKEPRFDQPEIPEEMELLVCLHTLDSAFDRILTALNLLNARMALQAESVQAKSDSIAAIRTAISLELRDTVGETGLKHFDAFSQKIRQSNDQLITECLIETYGPDITVAEA